VRPDPPLDRASEAPAVADEPGRPTAPGLAFLQGGGATGDLLRAHGWSDSSLGAPADWPQPLKTLVGVMLGSTQPMFVAWGPGRTLLYNDAYAGILAAKHPDALGRDLLDVWCEIRDDLRPIVERAYAGVSVQMDEIALVMHRKGYPEETHFSFFYAPVRDAAGAVAGLFCACTEHTAQVLAERRRDALLRLDDRLRDVERIDDLSFAASELLGSALGAVRVGYGVIDAEAGTVRVERHWSAPGLADVAGLHAFADYGSYLDELLRGHAVANADVAADPRTIGTGDAFQALGIRAHLDVPVVENGRTVAQFFVHSPVPRAWTQEEIAFVRNFAERTHAAIARRLAERALRESEERQAFLLELGDTLRTLPTPADIAHAAAGRLAAKLGASRVFYAEIGGGRMRVERDVAQGVDSIVGEHSLAAFGPDLLSAYRTGAVLSVEDTGTDPRLRDAARAGLRQRHVAAFVDVVLFDLERSVGVMAVQSATPRRWTAAEVALIQDVGERVKAAAGRARTESALRASEARFRLMADAVPQIVWITDAEGHAEFFNRQWTDYTGEPFEPMRADEIAAQHVHPDDAPATVEAFEAARRTGTTFRVEHRIRSRTGAYRWFLVRGEPYRDPASGAVVRWFGASVDIHDRRQAETSLRDLNDTLGAQVAARSAERDRLWQLSQDMLARADYSGMMSAVSPAWGHVLGWSENELLTRPYATFMHPDDMPPTLEAIGRMAETGRPTRFENRIAASDGGFKPIEWTVAPEPDGVNFIAVGRDLSANKAREAELAAAQDALRQAQKMEAVGQLTGGVAHDFNNLLTIIKSSTDLLRRPNLPDDRRRRYVDAIADTVDRASKLTGQLLAFARRQALKPEVFDAGERLRGIADMLGTVVGSRIEVAIDAVEGACHVEADASQFETALVNMAVNARDAMDGEGTLAIRVEGDAAMPSDRAPAGAPGRFVAVSLADTGCGIPAEHLHVIFEPFFTTKEVGKGTGLGLSQVFGFAKQSGGDVTVASTPGRGTTFTLYLPQIEPGVRRAGAPVDAGAEPAGPASGRRILVVEDNAEVGRFATQVLEDLGYATVWARTGAEALERLAGAQGAVDAVFSDVVMPGVSGIELGREIRRRFPGLPVVLASGYSHVLAEEGRHGFELLHKPYAADDLAKVLGRAIRGDAAGG
jgi:PAS domain S-box-containing protein